MGIMQMLMASHGGSGGSGSGSQPAFVQSQIARVNAGTGSGTNITLPGATTAGNYALIMVMAENLTESISTVTRGGTSQGGAALISPQQIYGSPGSFRNHWYLTGALTASSTAFVVTMTGTGNYDICVVEVSGLHATTPLDTSGLSTRAVGSTGTPPATSAVTRTAAKTIMFSMISGEGAGDTTPSGGATELHDGPGTWATDAFGASYKQYTSSGSEAITWDTTSGGDWYRIGYIVLKGT